MRTLPVIVCLVVVGCSDRRVVAEDTGTSTDTDTSTTSADTYEEPPCNEVDCDETCALVLDACENNMHGVCEPDGACECESPEPCVDCEQTVCENIWEHCCPYAGCTPCYKTTEVAWNPNLDCTIDMSSLLPQALSFVVVEIAGEPISLADSCDEMSVAWCWLPAPHMKLCKGACAAFEQAGSLDIVVDCIFPGSCL